MTNVDPLSPIRRDLCSYDHAARLAETMAAARHDVVVVSTRDPLQPFRVVQADAMPVPVPVGIRECA